MMMTTLEIRSLEQVQDALIEACRAFPKDLKLAFDRTASSSTRRRTVITTATHPDRASWLAAREGSIGSSEAPTIYGCNRWQSRYRLWGEKLGIVDRRGPDDDWGNCLEDAIAKAFALQTGDKIIQPAPFTIHRNSKYPWAHCTVDRFTDSVRMPRPSPLSKSMMGVAEIKSTGGFFAEDWAEEVPLAVSIQIQHQLAITELEWAVAIALIGGHRFKLVWGYVERDQETIDQLMREEKAFVDLINSRTPPAIDESDDAREVVERLHPNDNGSIIQLGDEFTDWDEEIQESQKLVEFHQARYDLRRNQLRAAIGNSTYGYLTSGVSYSYKTGKDGTRRLRRKDRKQR